MHRSHRANIVIELGKPGKDRFHKFPLGVRIDRFRDRRDPHAVFGERSLYAEVICDIASEPVDFPDDEHIYDAFLSSAEINEIEQLSPIRELRRFALLDKHFEDMNSFRMCVLAASRLL